MTLSIENKYITLNFIAFIKRRLLGHMMTILNVNKLSIYDNYFTSEEFKLLYNLNININTFKIIKIAMLNLTHVRYGIRSSITIDRHITYPGTNVSIYDLCKLINYGALNIDAYPIFTETFNHFSNNITKYIDKYSMGVG